MFLYNNGKLVVVAGIIRWKNEVLLTSRPPDKPPFGWEFPGGKVEFGESLQTALRRELREELALDLFPSDEIFITDTDKVELHFIRVWIPEKVVPIPKERQHCFWTTITPIPPVELLPNDLRFWNFLSMTVQ